MKLNTIIGLATLYMILFVLSVYTLGEHPVTGALFILSPFMMIWMVIRILKDKYTENRKFEEYFYADRNVPRVKVSN